jgi:hypothetical protein
MNTLQAKVTSIKGEQTSLKITIAGELDNFREKMQ